MLYFYLLTSSAPVDVGEGGRIRTICSGLVKYVPLEQMLVRKEKIFMHSVTEMVLFVKRTG